MSLRTFKSCILMLCGLYGLFVIFNVWGDFVSGETFFKITITFGVVMGFLGIYYLLMHAETDKDLEKKGYMSE